jgi:glycyl-tRNA synthetase (class II)
MQKSTASVEIYDGLSAVYDYAQNGVELKRTYENIGGNQWFK